MAGLTEERCEKTDLPVYSCPCAEHLGLERATGPKRSETEHPPPPFDGDRPSKDAIFVSSTRAGALVRGLQRTSSVRVPRAAPLGLDQRPKAVAADWAEPSGAGRWR